jgi:CheY-like chemotaxis protein
MKPIHLLLVEDSEDDMQLMLLFLRQGGYEPLYARVETDAEFRAELQRQPWDLIICDYNLPRFTGMKALAVVQELELDIPFIL